MDVRVYKITSECFLKPGVLNLDMVQAVNPTPMYLNTLTVSSIKTKGPTKIFKSGLYNIPVAQCGNTTTIELKDALGRLDVLKNFFNFQVTNSNDRIYKNIGKNTIFALEGVIKIINAEQEQEVQQLFLFIPFFIPNQNIDIISDTTNKFGVFDLSGNIYPMTVEGTGIVKHQEFYSLSQNSIFSTIPAGINVEEQIVLRSVIEPTEYKTPVILDGDNIIINVQN